MREKLYIIYNDSVLYRKLYCFVSISGHSVARPRPAPTHCNSLRVYGFLEWRIPPSEWHAARPTQRWRGRRDGRDTVEFPVSHFPLSDSVEWDRWWIQESVRLEMYKGITGCEFDTRLKTVSHWRLYCTDSTDGRP